MSKLSPEQKRYRAFVLQAQQVQDAAHDRNGGSPGALTVTIGNVDLPAFVAEGDIYIQATLPYIFDSLAASLPDFLRDMEVRVSNTRGAALALAHTRRALSGKRLAKPHVVSSGGQQ